ncbi:type VII secretion protein EccCa [Streptomyces sp. SCL15-6]|uniref:type VII secretion protein EccCa n=1 Tax=Streptomyces sp. SCL15-6 TaxID=2967222 RepID=UPI002966F6D1|nr:type VII secretion protein EccCa [Streptomyces sp. SCL15-6]
MTLFRRPARRRGPDMPSGQVELHEPPVMSESTPTQGGGLMTYIPMALMSGAMVLLYAGPGASSSPVTYLVVGGVAVAMTVMILGQIMRGGAERKQKLKGARRDYLRYLAGVRRKVRGAVRSQQQALAWRHPHPGSLWSFARTSRLWERRTSDDDFGEVRLAVGEQRLATQLTTSSSRPVEDLDPLSAHALRAFIQAYSTVPEQPIGIFLPAWARVLIRGDREQTLPVVRALVAQLCTMHSPEDLVLAFCLAPEHRGEWEWVKWLPHVQQPSTQDAAGAARRVAHSATELQDLLGEAFTSRPPFEAGATASAEEPFTVVVVDGGHIPDDHRLARGGYRNSVVVDLSSALAWRPGRTTLRLDMSDGAVALVRTDRSRKESTTRLGRADHLSRSEAGALARVLAPVRTGTVQETAQPLANDTELTTLLGISDLRKHDVQAYWTKRANSTAQRLRVPIAVGAGGRPVELDIKESAENGMGPHGMLIGATGSGKSELLRTLVLALALGHSSETLNFVLVDFKGGATFLGLDQLPHTSAVITNLADEAALVSRMQDALHGELIRRQELLRAAGNYSSAHEYETARAAGTPLAPLPSLFIVVDEFSELLSAHREFMDLFVMIGRLGRSLGVHLLLASQRLDEGRMHHLESHLSYRIGLRTFSAMESRGVLGVPDAYELPSQPGAGYLKSGTEPLTRFRAAYVSGGYRQRFGGQAQAKVASQVVPWTTDWIEPKTTTAPAEPEPEPALRAEPAAASLLSVAIEALRDAGPPAHQVWLPPLDTPPTLDRLLPPLSPDPVHGLTTADWASRGRLTVPVGVIDRPFDQRRDLLTVDLAGAGGHIGIAGGPQSGKSTLVRDVIAVLALTHTPREVQFYCLDFGGGSLAAFQGLPHVGSVASRLDTERVGRTIAEISNLLARRERLFAEHGVDSMASLRRRRAQGEFPEEEHGDVFLVIDGWSSVRQDFQDHVATINEFATRGLNYGIHLITTTTRWVELTSAVRDQSATKLELRMGDPLDSVVDIRRAATVPRAPGRGLTPDSKLHFLTALPRIDGSETGEDLAEGVSDLVSAVADNWAGASAPPVRLLPTLLPAHEVPSGPADRPLSFPLGLEEDELGTAWHDFSETPHLIAFGDSESGKTNLLRLMAKNIAERFTPAQARILVVDYRRDLIEAVPPEYRLGHAVSIDQLNELISGVSTALTERMPGPDISPARMRKADWWRGPRLFVLIDDYDLVARPMQTPFEPILDHLALGYEVGVHVVVARAATGAVRGMNDPLVRRLLEVNTPALLMSCPPSEGYLFNNVKPRNLPPGRGLYITRRKTVQVHTSIVPAPAAGSD